MSNISLDEVTALARELLHSKEVLEKRMAYAKEAADRVKFIEDTLLPSTLREVDLLKFTLSDGRVISVESNISATITENNWPGAEAWLIANQCDGIIKNQVITEFDRGQNAASEIILEVLEALLTRPNFLAFVVNILENENADGEMCIDRKDLLDDGTLPIAEIKAKKSVHPQTLKAFVRECFKDGREVPEDLFSLFITDHVKITNPK